MVFKIAWRLTRDLVAGIAEPGGASAVDAADRAAARRRDRRRQPGELGRVHLRQRARLLGGLRDRARADRGRQLHRRGRASARSCSASSPRSTVPSCGSSGGPTGCSCSGAIRARASSSCGLFALIPVLWFLPELWGSGHLLRGVTRAQHPRSNSAAFAKCPVCTVFKKEAWPTVLNRVKIPGIIALFVAAFGLWRTRASWWRHSGPRRPRHRGTRVAARAGPVRLRLVARDRVRDAGRVLGQQPLPGARHRPGRDRGRGRVGLVLARRSPIGSAGSPGCLARASRRLTAPGRSPSPPAWSSRSRCSSPCRRGSARTSSASRAPTTRSSTRPTCARTCTPP